MCFEATLKGQLGLLGTSYFSLLNRKQHLEVYGSCSTGCTNSLDLKCERVSLIPFLFWSNVACTKIHLLNTVSEAVQGGVLQVCSRLQIYGNQQKFDFGFSWATANYVQKPNFCCVESWCHCRLLRNWSYFRSSLILQNVLFIIYNFISCSFFRYKGQNPQVHAAFG